MKRLFLVACGLLLTVSMFAQTTKGEINGTVFDESGAALPGVTVVINSTKMQGTRTTVTNAKGFYRFPLLPAGLYTATYSIPGFATYTNKGIGVKVGEKTTTDITLKAAKLSESIVVTAEAPLVDTSTTDSSTEMTAAHLSSIPTLARSVEDMAKFVPGVTGVRMDSVNGGEGGQPSIAGSGQEGNQYMVDGTSVRSSMGFENNVAQNFDSIDSLQIVTDPFSPEFGKTMGGAINAVTKSGGNEFHGEAGFQWRNSGLEATRQPVQNDSSVTGFTVNKQWYNLGGPIIKDKLWFFVSYNFTKNTWESSAAAPRTIDAANLVNLDGTPYGSDYVVFNFPDGQSIATTEKYFYKLTYNITENMNLAFSGLNIKYERTDNTGNPDLYRLRTDNSYRYKLNFNWIVGEWGVLEARYGTQHENFNSGGLVDHSVASRYNTTIGWSYANRSRYDIQVQDRDDYALKWTGYLDTTSWGSHEYSLGWTYQDFSTNWLLGQTGAGELVKPLGPDTFNDGCDFNMKYLTNDAGQIVMGTNGQPIIIPRYLTERRDSINPNTVHSSGFFLQDRITMGKWTVMLGWRFDNMEIFNDLGESIWKWGYSDYSAPRVSVIYDLHGDQKHIFKAAYGEFMDATTTRIAEFFNKQGGNAYRQYTWIGSQTTQATEAQLHDPANWELNWEQSPDNNPIDYQQGMKPNSQKRWIAEYDWRINPNHAMTVRYTKAYASGLLDDYAYIGDDGWDYWQLGNVRVKRRDFKSIDLIFKGNFGSWMDYMFSYTWTDSRGTNPNNFENESLNNPGGSGAYIGVFADHVIWDNGALSGYGPYHGYDDYTEWIVAQTAGLGNDQVGDEGWYGKLSDSTDNAINFIGNFHLPKDFNITTAVQWNSGYFWAKKGYQPLYGAYFTFPEGRGSRRTSSLLWVDVTITKDFKIWYDHTLQLRLDIFNMLNSQKPISYVEEDTVDFGTPFARQDPRAIQLGVSYKF